MPLLIPNTTLLDDYDPSTTFAGGDIFQGGFFTIANNPAAVQLAVGQHGQAHWSDEQYLPPATYPIVPGSRIPISGIRARNFLAGQAVQFFGGLVYPGEPSVQAGTPYSAIVSAGGAVTTAQVDSVSALASANLALGVADVLVPGTNISFSVVGSQAEIMIVFHCDYNATVTGFTTCVGSIYLDGIATGAQAIMGDDGSGAQRFTVGNSFVTPVGSGPHNIQIRARKLAAGGTVQAMQTHTSLTILLIDK